MLGFIGFGVLLLSVSQFTLYCSVLQHAVYALLVAVASISRLVQELEQALDAKHVRLTEALPAWFEIASSTVCLIVPRAAPRIRHPNDLSRKWALRAVVPEVGRSYFRFVTNVGGVCCCI